MSYLRGDYYFWVSGGDDGRDWMHIWSIQESLIATGNYDPTWKSSVMVPSEAFDKVVRRRAVELGWTPPLVEPT